MNPNDPNANPNPAPAEAPAEAPTFTPGISNAPQLPPEPAQPTEGTPAPADPAQPSDPSQPAPQADPNAPAQPAPTDPNANFDYDAYLNKLMEDKGVVEDIPLPTAPTQEELANDDQALTKFFGDLVDTAVKKATNEQVRQTTIREAESRAWEETFTKYPEIKEAKGLRDTIHNIRIGAYQRGQSLTPLQVADQLIGDLHQQYKKGVNDTIVQTTVRDSQPLGGGSQTPPANPAVDYAALQDGGQDAAIAQLTKLIDQNKI